MNNSTFLDLFGVTDADTEEKPEAYQPNQKVFLDWSNIAEKLAIILEDGTEFEATKAKKVFDSLTNSAVYCENIPQKHFSQLDTRNNVVYRCTGNDTAELRIRLNDNREKSEITDIEDCRVIKALFLESPEKFRIFKGDPPIRTMQGVFKMLQKSRTGIDNQMSAQIKDSETWVSLLLTEKMLKKAEDAAVKECEKYLKEYPIWTEYLQHVKGCGPKVASGIIGITLIHGIGAFKTESAYTKFFGVHCDKHGLAARKQAGSGALDFSIKRKTLLMGDLAPSLIRSKSEYKLNIYDPYKARLHANNSFAPGVLYEKYRHKFYKPEATERRKNHMASMAERKMVQIFLEHLYRVWRLLEGYEVRNLYVIDHMGHSKYIKPFFIPKRLKGYFEQM